MSWTAAPGAWGTADPLFLLLIALGVEAYLGGRRLRSGWRGNPRRLIALLCLDLARRLNRPERGAVSRRRRGALVAGALALGALGAGWLAALVTRHYPFAWTLELFLLIFLIDQRATWRQGEAVQDGLASGSLVRAREALRPLTAETLSLERGTLDAKGVVGAALEALGRRFAGRLMAPVLWYVVLGLPGLFLQQTAYIMASVLQAQTERPSDEGAAPDGVVPDGAGPYGDAARSLARAVTLLPDVLAAIILAAAAAFVPGGRGWSGLRGSFGPGASDSGGGEPAAQVLGQALAGVAAPSRLNRALVVFAVAGLIDAALIAALALIKLAV